MLLLPLKNNAFAIFDFPSPIPEIHRTNRFLLNERSSTGTSERATRNLLVIVIGPCAYQSAAIEQQKRHTSDSSWVKAAVLHRLSSDGRRSFAVIQRELCFWGTGRDASMAALKLYSRRQWGDRCSNIRLYVSWRVIVFSFSLYLSLSFPLWSPRGENMTMMIMISALAAWPHPGHSCALWPTILSEISQKGRFVDHEICPRGCGIICIVREFW